MSIITIIVSVVLAPLLAGPLRPWVRRHLVPLLWLILGAVAGLLLSKFLGRFNSTLPYLQPVGVVAGVVFVLAEGPGWLWPASQERREDDHETRRH
jgi:hypothetical protein